MISLKQKCYTQQFVWRITSNSLWEKDKVSLHIITLLTYHLLLQRLQPLRSTKTQYFSSYLYVSIVDVDRVEFFSFIHLPMTWADMSFRNLLAFST